MNNQTVLLIEDDRNVSSSLSEILRLFEFSVYVVNSSDETISFFDTDIEPDFIILDYAMPGLDASVLIPMLKNLYDNTKIIIASGYSEDIIRKDSFFEHIDKFIAKPFNPKNLISEMRMLQGI